MTSHVSKLCMISSDTKDSWTETQEKASYNKRKVKGRKDGIGAVTSHSRKALPVGKCKKIWAQKSPFKKFHTKKILGEDQSKPVLISD